MEAELSYNYKNKTLDPGENCEVKIQCYFNRKYRYIDTGIYIEPEYWDNSTNTVSKKHPQSRVIDLSLSNKLNDLRNYIYDYERTGTAVFDFSALDLYQRGYKDSIYFSKFILSELENNRTTIDVLTYKKYKSNAGILARLMPDKPVCLITTADVEILDKNLRASYAESTVSRFNVFVQEYIKKAIKKNLIRENPYIRAELNTNRGEGKKTFLTMTELDRIEKLKHLTDYQLIVRDRFLYSCYTGLRISDNLALTKDKITRTTAGLTVDLHTIKGYGADLIHPLALLFDGCAERIALKYIDSQGEYLFPRQKADIINQVLPVLMDMAEIKKAVTFHTARHTCASNMAEITQNPFLLMNIMGWKDIRIAMNYVHSSPEATRRQLEVYAGKWN